MKQEFVKKFHNCG